MLPCAYDASVVEFIRAIETLRPDAVMMTGQAARRAAVSVERFARNLDNAAAPDNHGALRRQMKIADGGPERLEATAPVGEIAGAIRAAGFRRACRPTPEALSATISTSARCGI
jgi:pyroglutamyl-peptidase